MSHPLLQSALLFFALFAPACLVGILSYCAIMRTRDNAQDFFLVASLFVVALPSALLFVVAFAVFIWIVILCIVPASLERRMDGIHLFDADWHFVRLVAATYQSSIVGLCIVFFKSDTLDRLCASITGGSTGDFQLATLAAGFMLTPPLISLLRWMFHISKLRPGFDRVLEPGERASQ